MITARKVLGILLLASPFLVLFGFMLAEEGALFTLVFILALLGVVAIIFAGAWLVFGD